MFSHDFTQAFEDIFQDKKYPDILRLCHNYNNPGWVYNYHIHKDGTELVYIVDGKAYYTINMDTYTLEKGQLLIIEKGVLHSIVSDKNNPVNAWTCVIGNYKIKDFNEDTRMLNFSNHIIINTSESDAIIQNIMEQLHFLCVQKSPITDFACNSLCTTLTSLVYSLLPKEESFDTKSKSSFVRDILIYISEHYTESITIKQLSDVFHMSPGHISHSFAKEYGISPINYCIDLKMCEAKWLLINSNDSLTSISKKIGYDNTNHFTNIFTKRVNITPLDFRKKYAPTNDEAYNQIKRETI